LVAGLLLVIACARPPHPTPSPATYFGRFESADLRLADCFATAFHDLGIPPLVTATDTIFRATVVPWSCENIESWTLRRTATGGSTEHVIGFKQSPRQAHWGADGHHTSGGISPERWRQWLELRATWHSFTHTGSSYNADLDGQFWLLEWTDDQGYHWNVTNQLGDRQEQAVQWLQYLVLLDTVPARLAGRWQLTLRPNGPGETFTAQLQLHFPDSAEAATIDRRERCATCLMGDLPRAPTFGQPPSNLHLEVRLTESDSLWFYLGPSGYADDGGWEGQGPFSDHHTSGQCWQSGYIELSCGEFVLEYLGS
jgi:hypothetical protein